MATLSLYLTLSSSSTLIWLKHIFKEIIWPAVVIQCSFVWRRAFIALFYVIVCKLHSILKCCFLAKTNVCFASIVFISSIYSFFSLVLLYDPGYWNLKIEFHKLPEKSSDYIKQHENDTAVFRIKISGISNHD